ncbi:hypothetical protein PZB74_04430 [Porifericola rhodea]|uniref:hypothetical protein n=1 Tax=Porifericola rhodea TaxID=930972 RepID=UPI00266571C9|nr:hypothetical protein [Porifericola rhodea]WKN32589.1 hypothetical protein PZB74_04430 [Porifericola rhodea]
MTDHEFDVLDELYFVTSFTQLSEEVGLTEDVLKETLQQLLDKGWVKCFLNASEEAVESKIDFKKNYKDYFYLASKAGLLAHNGR